VIKRISLLVTAALVAAMMMVATAAPAFAAPATPHKHSETGPSQTSGPTEPTPGTCTDSTQQGANVTDVTHKGSCNSQGGQETITTSKKPPGKNK
jgi:hypothetical protein